MSFTENTSFRGLLLNETSGGNFSAHVVPVPLTSQKSTELLAWTILTPTLSFIGPFNNILLLIVIWSKGNAKSGFGLLIFHFTAANLFMCLINTPIAVFLVRAKQDGYNIPSHICDYVQAFYAAVVGVINWSDASLAVNRCIALFAPHSYRYWTTTKVNMGLIVWAWIMSLVAVVPVSFGVGGAMRMLQLGQCNYSTSNTNFGKFCFTLVSFLPYSIVAFGSLLLIFKSHRLSHTSVSAGVESVRRDRAIRHRLRIAKMVLLSFLWSAVCSTPMYVLAVNYSWVFVQEPLSALWIRTLLPCQYGLTPCVLLLSNAEYRSRLSRIFEIWSHQDTVVTDGAIGFRTDASAANNASTRQG